MASKTAVRLLSLSCTVVLGPARILRASAATKGGSALLLEGAEILLVIVALRKSGEFGQQRCEGGFLAFAERTTRRVECRPNAEGGCDRNLARDLNRAIQLLPGRGHVLNKTKSISLIGTPIITGQHVSHRITPACLANERDRRPASGEMTSGHFSLGEYGIARGNSYVSSEKKLVACALALALNCDN